MPLAKTRKKVGRPRMGTECKKSYNTKLSPETVQFLQSLPRGTAAQFIEDALQSAIAKSMA